MSTHEQTVHNQFEPRAQAYLTSAVHSAGPDLARAKTLISRLVPPATVALDIGCGGGHLSFTLAPHVSRMVALDPSPGMLAAVSEGALDRGLSGIAPRQGSAESLLRRRHRAAGVHPVQRPPLDAAGSRSARDRPRSGAGWPCARHRYPGPRGPAGRHVHAEHRAAPRPLSCTQSVVAEWRSLLQSAHLVELEYADWPTRLDFGSWVERMRTPPDRVAVIRSLQDGAPGEVRDALRIETDGSFTIRTGLFWLRKPA